MTVTFVLNTFSTCLCLLDDKQGKKEHDKEYIFMFHDVPLIAWRFAQK